MKTLDRIISLVFRAALMFIAAGALYIVWTEAPSYVTGFSKGFLLAVILALECLVYLAWRADQ